MSPTSAKTKESPDKSPKRIYGWPLITFEPYVAANFDEFPNGSIDERRAFYWGRVIGRDGVAFNLTDFPCTEESAWTGPVYKTPEEKESLYDKVKAFQDLYSRYGCGDNFLQVYSRDRRKGQSLEEYRKEVAKGMQEIARILKHSGVRRVLLDMEWSGKVGEGQTPRDTYEIGRAIINAMREVNEDFAFGFYPGLYSYSEYINYPAVKSPMPESVDDTDDHRYALIKGIYDARGSVGIWNWTGVTYGTNHMCTSDLWMNKKDHPFFWNLNELCDSLTEVYNELIGPEIEFMYAKWAIGVSQVNRQFKVPNLTPDIMRRNLDVLFSNTDTVGYWDHFVGWDNQQTSSYLKFENENEFKDWQETLKETTLKNHFMYDVQTQKYWTVNENSTSLEDKMKFFEVFRRGGEIHVIGEQWETFSELVNITKEFTGKDKLSIPLYSNAEVDMAKDYKKQGFFSKQEADHPSWGHILK